jgi:hypothetical protein
MKYYYSNVNVSHWNMLLKSIDENYASEYDPEDVLILGMYLNRSVDGIKQVIDHQTRNKLIIYQLEPLVENHWWEPDFIIQSLRGADEVWDYDLDNIEILKRHGIDAKFKPFLYTNALNTIQSQNEPEIDVLFYGTPSARRAKFFENFSLAFEHGGNTSETYRTMGMVNLYNISDHRLDEFIARSKIILNLNPYEGTVIQQQSRIFYPLSNGKCVMSQKSNRNYFGNCIVEFTDFQDFGEKAIELIQTGKWRDYPKFPNSLSFSKDRQDSHSFFNKKPMLL